MVAVLLLETGNPDNLTPVHTRNHVEATLSNATKSNVASTKSNVASTLLPFLVTTSNEIFGGISSFRGSRNKLNMLNLFRLCRKDEISFGNNVEATFDFVEATLDFVEKLFDL